MAQGSSRSVISTAATTRAANNKTQPAARSRALAVCLMKAAASSHFSPVFRLDALQLVPPGAVAVQVSPDL
ncbi:MAG: hypothetical protein ACYCXH_09235 [Bellilinea sp.]